jgi:serine/threonine protein phosphatase PrpC
MLGRKRKHLLLDTAALTDTGMVRKNNEDTVLALDIHGANTFSAESYGIYLVADGMGGHQAGEVASEMAAQIISETLLDGLRQETQSLSPPRLIKQAIEKANTEIYHKAGDNPELLTMGTTVTLGLRLDKSLYLGHVGDSRAYLIRKGKIRQLTEDHSLIARLLKDGVISPEEAETHPDRSKILRCLGVTTEVKIDTCKQTSKHDRLSLDIGDSLVFCTDGLTNHVSDEEIRDYVQKGEGAEVICRELINLANLRGGSDNISVIVVRTMPGEGKK